MKLAVRLGLFSKNFHAVVRLVIMSLTGFRERSASLLARASL